MVAVQKAVQAFYPGQDRLQLVLREQRRLQPIARGNGDTAALALGGHQGDARAAQRVDIAGDGAARHLKFFSQLGCGHGAVLQKSGKNAQKPVGAQSGPPPLSIKFLLYYNTKTRQLYVLF